LGSSCAGGFLATTTQVASGNPRTVAITSCGRVGTGNYRFSALARRIGSTCPTQPIAPSGTIDVADGINCFDFPVATLPASFLTSSVAPSLAIVVSPSTISVNGPQVVTVTRSFVFPAGFEVASSTFAGPLVAVSFAGQTCASVPTALVSVAAFPTNSVTNTFTYTGCDRTGSGALQFNAIARRMGTSCPVNSSNQVIADNLNCFEFPPQILIINATGFGSTARVISNNLAGTWWNPSRSGEGFFIDINDVGSRKVMIAAWFTYINGAQQWIVGSADVPSNANFVEMDMITAVGTGFGTQFQANQVQRVPWGRIRFEFPNCNELRITYTGNAQSGSLILERQLGPIPPDSCPLR
jgi:hypothetical protein